MYIVNCNIQIWSLNPQQSCKGYLLRDTADKFYTHFLATDATDKDTDVQDEPISETKETAITLSGPFALMNIMEDLFEDQDAYNPITGSTEDDHPEGNVMVVSSLEDAPEPLSNVNYIPLMESVLELQGPGMLEEIPIIEEVVVSDPDENINTHYMGDAMPPPVIQKQMVDIMEEVSQFTNRVMQEMKNRFRPVEHDKWMAPNTQPIKVIPIQWEETADDYAMDDAAEVDKDSHGAVDEKVHTPSAEEPDDKKKDAKTVEEESPNALKLEAKPEEKVLIRTERVTIPGEEPADNKPTLHIIQASTKEGDSKMM